MQHSSGALCHNVAAWEAGRNAVVDSRGVGFGFGYRHPRDDDPLGQSFQSCSWPANQQGLLYFRLGGSGGQTPPPPPPPLPSFDPKSLGLASLLLLLLLMLLLLL